MTVTGQPLVTYSYDNADRMVQLTQGSSSVLFAYDADGRQTSQTLPNGVSTSYSYDGGSQLSLLSYQGASQIGNIVYGYDLAGRVAQVTGSFARTGLPSAVSSAAYDVANRLSSWSGATFGYDANGNLTNDGSNAYVWDARNQLSSITGSVSASFQYDPLGRRIGKTVSGATTGFLFAGSNVVQELSGSTPTANLLTGGLDEVFARTSSSTEHFLTDGLGSSVATTDSTGSVATQYTYEPFGGTSSFGSYSSNAFQYAGRENDGTGLYYYRARYYKPGIGRFISEDPIGFIGGSTNLYGYARFNPLSYRDPTGMIGAAAAPALARTAVTLSEAFAEEVATGSMAGPWGAAAALAIGGAYYYYATHKSPDGGNNPQNSPGSPTAGRYTAPAPEPAPTAAPGGPRKPCYDQNDVDKANKEFPNKANRPDENHHITPKYLGGDPAGPVRSLPAAYHQQITNAFRKLWPYGSGDIPTAQELQDIMNEVYSQYPYEKCR